MSYRFRVGLTLLSAFLFCLVMPRRAAAQQCEHEAQRTAAASTQGVERIAIHAHAGSLEVTGRAGATQASARGRACASDADDLAELALRVHREGTTLVIEATDPDDDFNFGNDYARLDMVVEVPQGIAISIEDGSGGISVSGVGATRVSDGSGSIRIVDVRGGLVITDGSGEIEISGVVGSVEIEDGSGEIEIADVRGDIEIEDGSGSIRAERVGGDFIVDDDGSGGVSYANITGRVSVPDDD